MSQNRWLHKSSLQIRSKSWMIKWRIWTRWSTICRRCNTNSQLEQNVSQLRRNFSIILFICYSVYFVAFQYFELHFGSLKFTHCTVIPPKTCQLIEICHFQLAIFIIVDFLSKFYALLFCSRELVLFVTFIIFTL